MKEPNASGNAGWRLQFRFAVDAGWSGVPELWTLGDVASSVGATCLWYTSPKKTSQAPSAIGAAWRARVRLMPLPTELALGGRIREPGCRAAQPGGSSGRRDRRLFAFLALLPRRR